MPINADYAFEDNEDFVIALTMVDRNYNAIDFTGSTWKLAVKTSAAASTPSLMLRSDIVTLTIASPGVFTLANHGFVVNQPIMFTTTGALPVVIAAGSQYYILTTPTANTFTVSTTVGGSAVNTTGGSQSGVHTANAGINPASQSSGSLVVTFPKGLLAVGAYVYDMVQMLSALSPKFMKGAVTIDKGIAS